MSSNQAYAGPATLESGNDEANRLDFVVRQIIGKMTTATLVRVESVSGRKVGIKPLVAQTDGAGNAFPHGTINNVPVLRLQAGGVAVIMDPVVGDVGLAIFCHSDISSVVANDGKPSNPGSRRKFDWSDAVYVGGLFGDAPAQYVKISGGGIELVAPTVSVSENLSVGNGATGNFTDAMGQVVTVVDGIVTGIV